MLLAEFEVKGNHYLIDCIYQENADIFQPDEIFVKRIGIDGDIKEEKTNNKNSKTYKILVIAVCAYINDDTSIKFTNVCERLKEIKDTIQTYSYSIDGRKIPNKAVNQFGEICNLNILAKDGTAYYNNSSTNDVCIKSNGEVAMTNTDKYFVMQSLVENFRKNKLLYIEESCVKALKELTGGKNGLDSRKNLQ